MCVIHLAHYRAGSWGEGMKPVALIATAFLALVGLAQFLRLVLRVQTPLRPGRLRGVGKLPGLLLCILLAAVACARAGTLEGTVVVPGAADHPPPATRLRLGAVATSPAFERDWATARAAFHADLVPVRQAEAQAGAALEQARLAWDRAVATPRSRGEARGSAAQVGALWRQLRGREAARARAQRRVAEVARQHGEQALTLLEGQTVQAVETDGTGHYLFSGLPRGRLYLYVRVLVGGQPQVWFRAVQVGRGVQQVDLTEADRDGWPFRP